MQAPTPPSTALPPLRKSSISQFNFPPSAPPSLASARLRKALRPFVPTPNSSSSPEPAGQKSSPTAISTPPKPPASSSVFLAQPPPLSEAANPSSTRAATASPFFPSSPIST